MNICGDCAYYPRLNGSFLCQLTGKEVGYLHQKDCFTPKEPKMDNNEQPKTKVCKRCGRELPLHEFGRHARTKDGLQTYCRQCCNDAEKRSRKKKNEAKLITHSSENYVLDLCEISTEDILNELKRRGYSGYLKRVEEISL